MQLIILTLPSNDGMIQAESVNLSTMDLNSAIAEIARLTNHVNRLQTNQNNPTDNESNIPQAGDIAYQNLTNPKQFPASALDHFIFRNAQGDPVAERKIIQTFEETFPFPTIPNLRLKGDCDSVCAASSKLEEPLDSFGNATAMTMSSTICPEKKIWSSRFCIDSTPTQGMTQLPSANGKKLSLGLFPSVEIGHMSFGLHRPMTIYLVNLATPQIFKDHMFNKIEISVITAALNFARHLSKTECNRDQQKDTRLARTNVQIN